MKNLPIGFKTIFYLSIFLFAISCNKEEIVSEPAAQIEQIPEPESELILGEQLENPYSVENMQRALESLEKSKKHSQTAKKKKIKATHLYIKFKPKNHKQMDILKRDTTIVLYPYPLDREIVTSGNEYKDPTVPKNKPMPQYAAVKVGKKLPKDVKYKVL